MFAILLLDVNSLSSAKYAPKKWNVNYITISGLNKDERLRWNALYEETWTSVDSELYKELAVITGMLNTLEDFGYTVISNCVSQPRTAHKENENNRECYIWTLQKQPYMHCPSVTTQETPIMSTRSLTQLPASSEVTSSDETPFSSLNSLETNQTLRDEPIITQDEPSFASVKSSSSDPVYHSTEVAAIHEDAIAKLKMPVKGSGFAARRLIFEDPEKIRFECRPVDADEISESSDV